MPSPAAFQPIDTLTVGGRVFTNISGLLQLYANIVASTGTNSTFRKPGAASGYQVPASKTFTVAAVRVINNSVAGLIATTLLYGDADVGMAGTTAFTNATYIAGASAASQFFGGSNAAVNFVQETSTNFAVPTTKYPSITSTSACEVQIFGYEG